MLQNQARPLTAPAVAKRITAPQGADSDRAAYNAAFSELELNWHWDADTYSRLLAIAEEAQRIQSYIEHHHRHLLRAYDAGFLSNLILETKRRLCAEMGRTAS